MDEELNPLGDGDLVRIEHGSGERIEAFPASRFQTDIALDAVPVESLLAEMGAVTVGAPLYLDAVYHLLLVDILDGVLGIVPAVGGAVNHPAHRIIVDLQIRKG